MDRPENLFVALLAVIGLGVLLIFLAAAALHKRFAAHREKMRKRRLLPPELERKEVAEALKYHVGAVRRERRRERPDEED